MKDQDILRFVQEIIKNNDRTGTPSVLREFARILEKQGAQSDLLRKVIQVASICDSEIGDFHDLKKELRNRDLTKEDIEVVYRRFTILKKRRDEERRNGRC